MLKRIEVEEAPVFACSGDASVLEPDALAAALTRSPTATTAAGASYDRTSGLAGPEAHVHRPR
jgi:hypothetical protein